VGEEIILEAILQNNSDKEMIVFWSDGESANLSGGGGESLLIHPTSMANVMYIKPKSAVEKVVIPMTSGPAFTIHYDNLGMAIDLLHGSNQEIFTGTLTSNTITIEVKDKGEAESK
jgi:hypothetical protein